MTKDKNKEQELKENVQEQAPETEIENAQTESETAETAEAEAEEKDPLAEAQEQLAALNDKYLRLAAEFDNFRKRTIKEKADLILTGGEKVLSALLPVLDDLERARDNMQKSTDVESLREGVEMIIGKLDKTLAAQGLKRMEPIGTLFDTDFHEAIALVPVPEDEKKGHVIDCVQTGYLLGEKVVRHAKVVVGQ
ncbi:MAG: nucleotide exchange factor GrpE [Alloprevotella sp.]